MPFIRNLWVASLTSAGSNSGTDSELVVIMNQAQVDVVHRDLGFGPIDRGGGKLYSHDISDSQVVPDDYYLRIGIRGDDAWRPQMIAAWCERFTSGSVVPLGYNEAINMTLSTDSDEGRISVPLPTVGRGRIRSDINRVMLVAGTSFGWAGTDSPIHVRITAGQSVVLDHTIPDTSQRDFEAGEGNVYFLPVLSQFTRSRLDDTSIVISIEGNDAWRPIVLAMFGLDTAAGQPSLMVPLVHVHPWTLGTLSTDPSEGVASVTLPLCPIDP
jgi:hypothetical protein